MDLVTVIIPSYNVSGIIAKAIDSVFLQSYHKIECIVIDGASTDGTVDLLKEKKVRYISEPDKGIYDAMNKGWKMAKGEWIIYLGADDELETDAVKHLMQSAINADVVYGDTTFIVGRRIKKIKALMPGKIKKGMVTSHQSMMMRHSMIEELGGFDTKYKISADFDLVVRAYIANYRFVYTPYFISIFNCNGISTASCKNIIEGYHIRKKHNTMHPVELYLVTAKNLIRKTVKLTLEKLNVRIL